MQWWYIWPGAEHEHRECEIHSPGWVILVLENIVVYPGPIGPYRITHFSYLVYAVVIYEAGPEARWVIWMVP